MDKSSHRGSCPAPENLEYLFWREKLEEIPLPFILALYHPSISYSENMNNVDGGGEMRAGYKPSLQSEALGLKPPSGVTWSRRNIAQMLALLCPFAIMVCPVKTSQPCTCDSRAEETQISTLALQSV